MPRVTKKELDDLLRVLNSQEAGVYSLEWAYGQPRLYTDGGSREVSPRLPTGQMADWMRAFLAGIGAARRESGNPGDAGGSIEGANPALEWSTFAGGTGAAEGKYAYVAKTDIGEYHVSPFTTQYGRHAGYLLRFVNTQGALPGGLWQGVAADGGALQIERESKYRSPQEAKRAARLHYEWWSSRTRDNPDGASPEPDVISYRLGNRDYKIREYGPGKFNYVVDTIIYAMSGDFVDSEAGDVSEYGEWCGIIRGRFTAEDIQSREEELHEELTEDERKLLRATAGVIICEDDQGFADVTYYDSAKELHEEWDAIVERYEKLLEEAEGDD